MSEHLLQDLELICFFMISFQAEQELSKIYPSRRRSSSSGGSYHSRVPVNPTRVDKMIHEQIKVHDKVCIS